MKIKKTKAPNWTDADKQMVIDLFPDNYTISLCEMLNRSYSSICSQASKLGLKKSDSFKKMELKKQGERLKRVGQNTTFKKGHTPQNKGKEVSPELREKLIITGYKKGHIPHNAYDDWKEVIRTDAENYKYWKIKIPGEKKLKYKHIWIWETINGPVEKGYNIIFKDGNQLNCTIENLECISNIDLMKRNTIHRFPAELKSTIKLLSKLNKKINATK